MVVTCPKCKVRLKVDEAKLSAEGSRFKCPKCSTMLIVKKPPVQAKKTLDTTKILVAHGNPSVTEKAVAILEDQGYKVMSSGDGIDAMVKALKELPFLTIVDVALPKIYGFEVCKRLKTRPETKDMKFILITSVHDKNKYKREPTSLYGADEYIEDHNLSAELIEKIKGLYAAKEKEPEKPAEPELKRPEQSKAEKAEMPEQKMEPSFKMEPAAKMEPPAKKEPVPTIKEPADEKIERARRLARTIMHDIYLYNSAKVEEAIRNNSFYSVFASEVKEGLKLYENRIQPEIRSKGDFFKEAIENFIASKK